MQGTKSMFWSLFFISLGVLLLIQRTLSIYLPLTRIFLGLFIIYLGVKLVFGSFGIEINRGKVNKIATSTEFVFSSGAFKLYDMDKTNKKFSTVFGNSTLDLSDLSKITPEDQIKIEKPGIYWIKANNKGCFITDTFKVTLGNGIIPNFSKELLICENESNRTLSVKAPNDVKLYWNTGANTTSINANKEGVYWVKSTSKNCGTRTDSVTVKYKNCDCDIYIPNSFTPNDDDRNDLFSPVFQCDYSYYLLTVTDRWGNTIYTSNNINGKWDGKFKGNPCPDDVYVYRIEAIQKGNDKKIIKNGHISLFR